MTSFRQDVLALVPRVKALADAVEKDRRIPAETIETLREIGLFRAFVPRVFGGDERSLSDVHTAMTDLAVACASTAWVGSLLAIHNIAVCWLEEEGQHEIFRQGPDVVLCSSVAPTGTVSAVPGGFRVAGRWSFSSGVDYASWIMLGARTATMEKLLCFVRASEVKLIDDWHVAGLRGTGSKSMEITDIFVPTHRTLLLRSLSEGTAPGLALHAAPFYRLPWDALFITAFPPAALGTAIAMLEGFREYTAGRINRFSGASFQTNAGSALRMAEAAAQIDAAQLVFRRDLAALDTSAQQGTPMSPGAAERIGYDTAFIVDACSRAVLRLFRGSGARVIHESSPLQRHMRDIHAMTQHASMDTDCLGEIYGRKLFQDPTLRVGARC